jgi:cystathionine beta-lyase
LTLSAAAGTLLTMSQPGPDVPPPAPPLPDTSWLVGYGRETICAHWADDPAAQGGAAAVPIYQASTFVFPDAGAFERRDEPGSPYYTYTRVGNPTTAVLQAKVAQLENGTWCYAVASGMGAIAAALNACTAAGAHVVCTERCYWPAGRYLRTYLPRYGVETTFVNSVQVEDYVAAFRPETRVLYIESPTSGTFDVLDVPRLAAAARDRGITTLFDNSWASPMHFNPLDAGVDLVVHSGTKYIGGHSDALAGFIVGRDVRLQTLVLREVELMGGTIDPFASWLMLRGLRTLPLRMERHARTALACAEYLATHPKVRRVRHPGLASHPQHEIARRQFRGWGSLFSFELADPSKDAAYRFVNALRLFSIGVSWGGYESLALAAQFGDPREGAWMVRLHCGLETEADLLADIARALDAV